MNQSTWEPEDWERCGSAPINPIRVIIIEALLWIERPLSARTIQLIMDGAAKLPLIAYHLRTLASVAILEKAEDKVVRGAVQRFYRLSSSGNE